MQKDEIKEILDYLKNSTFIPDETKRKYKILHRDEVRKLLDYITNLQKKYDKALSDLVKVSHKIMELSKNYDRIYNENCKLIEKHNITDISLLDENFDLQQEIEKLENDKRGMLVQLYKANVEKDNYKSRCEKAIEYIKTKEVDFVDVHYQQQDDYFNGLLNILQGSDKDCID